MRFGRIDIMKDLFAFLIVAFLLYACDITIRHSDEGMQQTVATDSSSAYDSSVDSAKAKDSSVEDNTINRDTAEVKRGEIIDVKNAKPNEIVNFAETLIGIPYRYGSTDPKVGFDCSGFITYVFKHFNISVPRSSIDFTNVGKEIPSTSAKRGDIILFTGTDSTERFVGHMGIVVSNTDTLKFIHSTSGRTYGVTISPLSNYYKGRFVKTLRLFKENDG
jgi:cell wall-associated NlpC family hydrolase